MLRLTNCLPNKIFFMKTDFLYHEDSHYSGVLKYCGVYKLLRCLSKNRLYTKMFRIHLFSIFTSCCTRALMPLNREDTDK